MAKELKYETKIKQNRGKIDIKYPDRYIPWILARECSHGDGTRHQIPDLFYKERSIHLMSDLEKEVYYTFRSQDNVLELFEQFPLLPVKKTEELCDKYNIKHPKIPKNQTNNVMTTDFLMIIKDDSGKNNWIACAVKPVAKLYDKRTREKLFIEKKYWENMNIKWCVITEENINKIYVKNIILCRTGYTGLGNSSLYDIAKYLIVNKLLDVDMYQPIDLDNIVYKIKKGEISIETNLYND